MRTKKNSCVCLCVVAVCVIVACSRAVAEDPVDSVPEIAVDPVDRLIEQLDASSFSDRADASRQLQRLGDSAILHLERAASHGSIEMADRALEILKRHFEGDDPVLSEAARKALTRIADSEEHVKSAGARQILEPSAPRDAGRQLPRVPIMPPIANRQIRIQVKFAGGDKDVTVVENGRKIRVVENANGILVEKPDGKGGVKQSKYKTVEELKEKDAEAHRAYQRATGKGQFGIQIQAGPGIPGLQRRAGPALPDEIRKRHQQLRKEIEQKHRDQLKRLEELRQQQHPSPPRIKEVQSPDTKDVVAGRASAESSVLDH